MEKKKSDMKNICNCEWSTHSFNKQRATCVAAEHLASSAEGKQTTEETNNRILY